MSSTDTSTDASKATGSQPPKAGEYWLEVIALPVSDVDRAKAFYQGLGWRLDIDFEPAPGVRVRQFKPTGSPCSFSFGEGFIKGEPGSIERLEVAVHDIEAARDDLIGRGVNVGEIHHHDEKWNRSRTRSESHHLQQLRGVQGSGRQRLVAPGDHRAPAWALTSGSPRRDHGRRDHDRPSARG